MIDRRLAAWFLGILLACPAPALAQAATAPDPAFGPAPAPASAAPAPGPLGPEAAAPSLLRVGAALLAVVALLLAIHAVLRRTSLAPGGSVLRLETRLPVARGGHVAVVRVDGRRLLVGVTPTSVNLITELGDAPSAGAPPAAGRFDQLLSGLLRRKEGSG